MVNRPVRTRMPWWCGEGGLDALPYPISRLSSAIIEVTEPLLNLLQ
jgi:hypothetical protein